MGFVRFLYVTFVLLVISACGGSGGGSSSSSSSPESTSTPVVTPTPSPSITPTVTPSASPIPRPTPEISSDFPGSVLLGKPTDSAITLSIVTETDTQLSVEYGRSSGSYQNTTGIYESIAGIPIEITLNDLSGSAKYFYRIHFRELGDADFLAYSEASFSTQKTRADSFNFAIHADAHIGIRVRGPSEEEKADDDQYMKTLLNTLEFEPDFLIDLGDTFMSEKNAQRDFYDMNDIFNPTPPRQTWVEEDYEFLRSFFNLIGHSVPLFLVNGNHEGEAGWEKHEQDSIAVWANNMRKGLYPSVSPNEFYSGSRTVEPFVGTHDGFYSWTWGSALFVTLDAFWYASTKPKVDNEWAWTLGKEQYDWLKTTLENSDARYKFIFLHNLVGGLNGSDGVGSGRGGALVASHWEWGGTNPYTGEYEFDVQRPGWGKPIHDILVENDVDVVFHGHDHVFVREDHVDGIIYQVLPQPSILGDTDSRAIRRAEAAGYDVENGVVRGGSGFLNVEVSPDEARVTFIRTLENEDCTPSTCYEASYSYVIPKMSITSPALKDTGNDIFTLPLSYTCDGVNGGTSPWLTWSGIPDSAVSLALTMHSESTDGIIDPNFTIFNISPRVNTLLAGDMSIGTAARGDMSNDGELPYNAPCAAGAGETKQYDITLYALSEEIALPATTSQAELMAEMDGKIISKTVLTTNRVHWDAESINNDLHVPSTVPSSCEEKTAHFMEYPRVHKSISCDESANQMNVVSHISDGLKTALNDQQIQVGITRWIGRLSFPSQAGGEIRIEPSYLSGVNNNISCDGTGKLGISVDGQVILPYYKQTNDASGDSCGPTDGTNYANRDTVVLGEVDQCYGHSPNGEGYHLHGAPICLMDVHDPSKPVAYMVDGIPLYFGQAGGTIENTLHAQTANAVTDTNFGAGLYEHLDYRPSDVKDGSNPLNDCNAYDINGDGPVSGYVYYTSKDAPYSIGCFMGEVLDSPTPVQVARTNFDGSRQGWTGQTVGQGIDVTILSNYFGSHNNKIYNITEMLVTESTAYLNQGDHAQVLWRVLEPEDEGYNNSSTCFELRYRANKSVTTNDETEITCTRSPVPQETLDFTPFDLNEDSALSSSVDSKHRFKLEAWADNWFAAYLGDQLIVEDSTPIMTERSFNAETAEFEGNYPLQLNVILKDFKANDTGLEYIGTSNQQMGDGGFIAQITDTMTNEIVAVTTENWTCLVIHDAPLDKSCEASANPVAGVAPCEFSSNPEPANWKNANYNDSEWANAIEYSAADVAPKEGYDEINWDSSAQFIWGPDLETNNTVLCRVTVEAP